MITAGMTRVRLAPDGRLLEWQAVSHDIDPSAEPATEPDWARFFALAGLDVSQFAAADGRWTPLVPTDLHRAWTRGELRIEAGSFRGRPVWFEVIPTWRARSSTPATPSAGERIAGYAGEVLTVLMLIAGVVIARRNIRMGRSDQRGATRLAILLVALDVAANLLRMPADPSVWVSIASRHLALAVYQGLMAWIFYVALEPYVRRLWPNTIIAWSRVLEGRFRDPLVGRHILIGALAGMLFSALFMMPGIGAPLLGAVPTAPGGVGLGTLTGTGYLLASYLVIVKDSFSIPVGALLGLLLLRVIFQRAWLAYAVLFGGIIAQALTSPSLVGGISQVAVVALMVLILTRFGLFAMVVAIIFSYWELIPLTTDPSSWFLPSSVISMLLFGGLAVYGFVIAAGDQLVFKDPLAAPSPAPAPPG
jgi:hypothetical protein